MEKPVIADKKPAVVNLKPGKYFWCACGKSKNQPFCDGSHKGTSFVPKAFEVTEEKTYYLCQCKQSKNAPFCDGTHRSL
ncbi:MAG TPA: CDGSH iron-sulfur domain-containing protein [Prolixibacteraceae bacterium]|nr:CDGSH iron-sulfur domain-containing protein [Prolixibacteraceae bacterium]